MKYFPRHMEGKLTELAKSYPVLVISGPRQSGKSTLAKNLFCHHHYVSLEDMDERMMAQEDPRGFLQRFQKGAIIDEIQRVPQLFSYIQGIVDKKKQPAQFVLTGSSQLEMLQGISQSLAGRASILKLLPLCLDEMPGRGSGLASIEEALLHGGYPNIHFDGQPTVDWYLDYCKNYLERDVRLVTAIKDLGTFQLFLKMCAARCGQIINYTSFANDCGISPNTAKEWLNILEASFIVFKLNAYYKNYSKRLIKSSKLYFYDSGVACSLLGITCAESLITHSSRGGIFESWVISEIQKRCANVHRVAQLYYWRSARGIEIDLIVEKLEKLVALEVKSGKTINQSFFKNLNQFTEITGGDTCAQYLVYGGEQSYIRNGTNVLSWRELTGLEKALR